MKELGHKFLAGLILLAFAGVVFTELSGWGPTSVGVHQVRQGLTLADSQRMFEDLGGTVGHKPVILFVTPWCGVCRALEAQLSKLGVSYVRADVEADRNASLYYNAVTQGKTNAVPVTVVGAKHFVGYDIGGILQALKELEASTSVQSA